MIWICLRVAICCSSTNSVSSRPTDTHRRPAIARGGLRRPAAGSDRRQETEAARDGIDQRGIVARHHAEMVADAIGNAGRQLHLDMPGRAVGRIDAPLLFCSSELTDTFIGATPPCATSALTAEGATGSIE